MKANGSAEGRKLAVPGGFEGLGLKPDSNREPGVATLSQSMKHT